MLYPSVEELTHHGRFNRYALVIATAKCARKLAAELEKEKMTMEEKPVKMAIEKLHNGEYQILEKDLEQLEF
ncbi:MAG: DNA-directed RNA polymerase subunit omega [Clostridia bacterium]|nr:DNA-directed RNA polymerase subunit omega [Clostridia bacterium]